MVSYKKLYLPVDSVKCSYDIFESISVTGDLVVFFVKISDCIYELKSICVHFH